MVFVVFLVDLADLGLNKWNLVDSIGFSVKFGV